jgi:hypothetical protein
MQTITFDEEIKLLKGLLYEIDFDQDFASKRLNWQPISEMPVSFIIEVLNILESENEVYSTGTAVSKAEEYRRDEEFLESVGTYNKKNKPKLKKQTKRFYRNLRNSLRA